MPACVLARSDRIAVSHATEQSNSLVGVDAVPIDTICRIDMWTISRVYPACRCVRVNCIDEVCICMCCPASLESTETAQYKYSQTQNRDDPATIELHIVHLCCECTNETLVVSLERVINALQIKRYKKLYAHASMYHLSPEAWNAHYRIGRQASRIRRLMRLHIASADLSW